MNKLSETHQDVYELFMRGFHPIRRSDREWAGLSTDLVIEQELMRSVKTSGGLTRGSRMSEIQRHIWVMSRPACAQINAAIQDLTGIKHKSSEQIKDLSIARIDRDFKDTTKIQNFLSDRNPFMRTKEPINIASGIHANPEVNVDRAKDIGIDILKSMRGMNPNKYVFQKKKQVVTLATKNAAKVKDDSIQIDPNLLFQRLASTAVQSEENLSNTLCHELCTYPQA